MKPLFLFILVSILGCAAFLLHSRNYFVADLGALRTHLEAGTNNNQGSSINVAIDIAVPPPGPEDEISFEEFSSGAKIFVESLIGIGDLIENSCQKRILDQEQSLDKIVQSAREFIAKNDLISAQIEIEKIRWKNICGGDHTDDNRIMADRYEGIKGILNTEIANSYSINTDQKPD